MSLMTLFIQLYNLGRLLPAPFEMRVFPDGPAREPDLIFISREHLDRLSQERLSGPADLVFNETRRFSLDGWGLRGEGFIAIADAKHVEGLVRMAIEKTFATRMRGPWQ